MRFCRVRVTRRNRELDAYLIIYIGWPDVVFSPDMSSFRDLKNASGRIPKTSGILSRRIFVFLWVFHKLVIISYKFWKGYLLAELYYCDCVWPCSCIDGLVLVYSSPRVVCFAKQFPARTLGGVTLFVEDDLRDAFFVGVAVVADCLFTFSQ